MKIESIRLKNFKAFKDTLMSDMPKLCVIVGANGTGKTTFFDVFDFLKDAYKDNISQALNKRGGFREVKSRNSDGPIEIEMKLSDSSFKQPLTYFIAIEDENGTPIIKREKLGQILDFSRGKGFVVTNELEVLEAKIEKEEQTLARPDILAIKGLAQFQKFSVIMKLGSWIETWHISDFHINSAKQVQENGAAEHLSREGENLSLVTHRLYERYPAIFNEILEKLRQRVPGIHSVAAKVTEEGRVLLKFKDEHFKDPFLARHVSDGTLKMFAYLVLLYDTLKHPLLCLEEPENQLYPKLLWELAEEFRLYANRGGQVFISTHSPDFINALELDEVIWLIKNEGYTTIKRARDDKQVAAFMAEGDQMGYLWKQGFFNGVDPQ
ncbi:MAG: chromosome segregation protein SMC [Candidatus Parabeggiatoa sp. nov. 3]|nr:MAG: chromosome segregation protein SMC [Gammaproteobacteria bacterium]RKZ68526.1 MAG: chromosome segregation protein SMC [Gammaproteobacteria bacterium]